MTEIRHTLTPSDQGQYLTLPFEVQASTTKVTVSYHFPPSATVDLGLTGPDGRFLGWSGSAHPEIFVSTYDASPGYHPVPEMAGTWTILIGAYKIPEPITVTYTIHQEIEAPRWFTGDLHMHTTASDGRLVATTIAARAQALGLDFIAITDHNNTAEIAHRPRIPGFTIIPGVEWTHYKGHMNIFGLKDPFPGSPLVNTEADMRALLTRLQDQGALISVNHPKDEHVPYAWDVDDVYHLTEIWNGPMRPANLNAIAWWHSQLLEGKRLPIIGGSDFHRPWHPARLAHPVTQVYSPTRRSEDLLAAIAQGHASVSNHIKGPQILLNCGPYMMGDACPSIASNHLNYQIDRLKPGQRIMLTTNTGQQRLKEASGQIPIDTSWTFAYIKVIRNIGPYHPVAAISNPIYFQSEA